jgi:hypothetical protein
MMTTGTIRRNGNKAYLILDEPRKSIWTFKGAQLWRYHRSTPHLHLRLGIVLGFWFGLATAFGVRGYSGYP